MTTLAGTLALVRLGLRRDRVRLAVWVLALAGLTYFSGSAMASAFPTQRAVDVYGASVAGSPALIAMTGPPLGLHTLAGIVLNKVGPTAVIGVVLLAVLTVVRHTRAEEEAGRTELLRAAVVGRYAGSCAAMLLASGASVVVGALTALALVGCSVPGGSAWLFGAGTAALGLVFAGVGLVAAQVFTHARTATGIALSVFGIAYVLRAVGDVQHSALVWLSPVGWSQATHVLGDERSWPLAVSLVAAGLLVVAAVALESRRDVGEGLVASRAGAAHGSRALAGPVGLAARLQRGALLGWAAGLFALSAAMGSLSREVADMARGNPTLSRYLAATGRASLTDTFLSTMLLIMALLATAFAVSSVLRLRAEETSGRAEVLLATGLSRTRWLLGSLLVTALGTVVLLLASGLGMGLAYGLVVHDAGQPFRLAGLALEYAPAALALVGLAALLVGWLPRAVSIAWAALAVCFVLGWLGGLIRPPRWLEELSPFWQSPAVPAEPVSAAAPLAISLSVVLLVAVGTLGLRRRDITA